jgi:hypothetical protein
MPSAPTPDDLPLDYQLPADAYCHLIRTLRLSLPPPGDSAEELLHRDRPRRGARAGQLGRGRHRRPVAPAAEAEHYTVIYPERAALIRRLGRVPDDEIVAALLTAHTPTLVALNQAVAKSRAG